MSPSPDSRPIGPRSYLFVPADRPERVEKACASAADAVIVDLEDAVEAAAKTTARERLAGILPGLSRPVFIRINAVDTAWHADDLELAGQGNVAGWVLPKAGLRREIEAVVARGLPVLALIESARGMQQLDEIAAVQGVERLLFGAIDFGVDMGIPGDGEALLYFRSRLVLASRLAGLAAPVDGVTSTLDDADQLGRDAGHARDLGFGGKLCVHPAQLDIVNRSFAPDAQAIAWAQRIADAGEGASQVDGVMVDKAVVERARAILEAARRFGVSA